MPDQQESLRVELGRFITILAFLPFDFVLDGLVVRYMYHRIFAPTFPGLPQHIGIAQAIGISMFISFMAVDTASAANDHRTIGDKVFTRMFFLLFVVVITFIVGFFI